MKVNECFILRKIKDDYFLVPFRKNIISREVIYLNNVGAQIFLLSDQCLTPKILADNVAELFGVKHDNEAKKMINDFISQMLEMGLLVE